MGYVRFFNIKHATIEAYGQNLDHLSEGDRVGVKRTSAEALHFYVNGDRAAEPSVGCGQHQR